MSCTSITNTKKTIDCLCISLGGTKFEIGAFFPDNRFRSHKFHWRERETFQRCFDSNSATFCDALVREAESFLADNGLRLCNVNLIGVAFPGPQRDGLWFSNNLTPEFTKGVTLESELQRFITQRLGHESSPKVRVLFDAQCDAGGELFDPRGKLTKKDKPAIVLNIATGVAAGFVKNGRVLISDDDFREGVGSQYDAGAGQLGRHLWFNPTKKNWRYRFRRNGRIPEASPGEVRMTSYISGPAIAVRLIRTLGKYNLLPGRTDWFVSDVPVEYVYKLYDSIPTSSQDLNIAVSSVHQSKYPLSTAILKWADAILLRGEPDPVFEVILIFSREIATELANALQTLVQHKGWHQFRNWIVLTGGVGINFLSSSDNNPTTSFLQALTERLPRGCCIERSVLKCASERESYLFLNLGSRPLQQTSKLDSLIPSQLSYVVHPSGHL